MRERREYIYRKHKEESEAKMRDRKEKLKRILAENKPIPSELKVRQCFVMKTGKMRNHNASFSLLVWSLIFCQICFETSQDFFNLYKKYLIL